MSLHSAVVFNLELGVGKLLLSFFAILANDSMANDAIPLPFEGLYESRGSFAKEKVAADEWREIPQDVQMLIVKDDNIVELQLLIAVHSPESIDGSSEYTIANRMWFVKRQKQPRNAVYGRVVFDVYKMNRAVNRFDDLGDGYCEASECRYSYVTAEAGHQQRYHSQITWQLQRVEDAFKQTGGLSVQRDGEVQWETYKTWENTFRRQSQDP